MFITNLIKIVGCLMMLFGMHPLLAYAVVGFGAAAYSPAKYGILTELLPPDKLVVANGWIEGLTVASIILGDAAGRRADRARSLRPPARDRHPGARDRRRHPGRGGDRAHRRRCTYVPRRFNLRIPDTGVALSAPASARCGWSANSAAACDACGATSSDRYRSPSPRCSGAPARRCSSSCSSGREQALGHVAVQATVLQGIFAVGIAVRRRRRRSAACRSNCAVGVVPRRHRRWGCIVPI